MEVIKFLGVIGITLMIVEYAQPIQWLKIYWHLDNGGNSKKLWMMFLRKVLNCAMCCGFYVGLAFYWDLYWAVVISFSSEIVYRLYNKFSNGI
jgi:uncharacterized protein (DUF2062 family)